MDATSTYRYGLGNPLRYEDPLGLDPTGIVPNAVVGCAYGVAKALENAFAPETSDKYKHCYVSGMMVVVWGSAVGANGSAVSAAAFFGIAEEVKDGLGTGDADLADLLADYRGLMCGMKALGGSQTVDSCCKSCYEP